jgi:hypothetical protein
VALSVQLCATGACTSHAGTPPALGLVLDGANSAGCDWLGADGMVEAFTILLWLVVFGGSCLLVAGVLWLVGKAMDWWLED